MKIIDEYLTTVQPNPDHTSQDLLWYSSSSKIHGSGVFASRDIHVTENIDVVFNDKEKPDHKTGKNLDRTKFGSLINHCSGPRCNSELVKEGKKYFLKSTKKIKKGKEITCDYNYGLAQEVSGGFQTEKDNCK